MALSPPRIGRLHRWAWITAVVWLLPLGQARAYEVCVDIPLSVALVDASPTDAEFFEDRGRDEGLNPFPLQRWLYRVVDHDQPTKVLAGWAPLTASGCTAPFNRDGATSVDLRYFPWAYLSGNNNSVVAYDCTSMPACTFEPEVELDIDVSAGSRAQYTIPDPEGPSFKPWLTALWSVSFAEQQFSPGQDRTAYLLVDFTKVIFGATVSDRILGGQPTTAFSGGGYRGKWNAVHEYAHMVAVFDPIPIFAAMDIDCDLNGMGHGIGTIEYQSCAAIEGLAHFFSAAVWTDVGTDPTINLTYVSLQQGILPGDPPIITGQFIGGNTICAAGGGPPCDLGTANERDWASALLEFAQIEALSVNFVIAMLEQVHPWPTPSMTNGDFWANFDTKISTSMYLDTDQKMTWDATAMAKEIDQ